MDSSEYDFELRPLTAGVAGRFWGWWKNYTSAERRANAAEQLRDRFGRFAEMGRDHKFKFKNKKGVNENATGVYIGPASRKGYGRFFVKDHPTLGTGVVEVSNKNFREVLTSLSEDYLRSRGISLGQDTTGNIVGARKESDIPSIDDLNIKPATDEDLEAASDQTEDIPDLNEVIKTAEEGAIRYGDLKAGVIVRDEAGNRLGIVTQVEFTDGKVTPIIRWQDGERGRGTESDAEDLVTVWIPAEDSESAEGNKEKASVKARLNPSLMAFDDKKTVTVADLKKGDSVVIGGETLKVKSKKDLKDGTFRIEFTNENGEVVEELISEPTDTFDLPAPEEKEPAKGKGKKPATPPRKSVAYFFDDVNNLGQLKILAKFGDVLVLPDGKGGNFEAYYISHEKGTDEKGRSGYNVVIERASDHKLMGVFIPSGFNTQQLVGPNGKTRVNRAKDVVAKKPTAPVAEEKGKKPTPASEPLSEDEDKPSQRQIDSINRRLNEGRYPGIVSESRAKEINDLMPNLTKGNVGKIIKELNDAELKWRMDNGWSVDELIKKEYARKDGTVAFPTKELAARYYAPYKPYKDENGDPIPGVEQPTETDKKPVAVVTDHPLPTSGEIGATGLIKGKVRYEIKEDGSIYISNDSSQKGDTTFPYIPIIRSVGYQRDGLGTSELDQIKENGKFSAWKIIPSIGQASTELLSIEDFRKEILQRLFNRINGIEDPNDVSQSVAEIPEGEVDEDASDAIQGTPGETGSLGNGVGFTISANGTVVVYGDVEFGSENSKLITSVLGSDRDGYEIMYDRDGDENFEVQINPTDRSVTKTQHTKNFLNALKKALSFATEEKPAEEPEVEELTDPWDNLPPIGERTLEDIVDALFRRPESISKAEVQKFGAPSDGMLAAIRAISSEPGVVSSDIVDKLQQILPNLDASTASPLIGFLKNAQNIKRMANGQRPRDLNDFSIFGVPKDVTDKFVDEIKLINFYLLSNVVSDQRRAEIEQTLKDGSSRENITELVKELEAAASSASEEEPKPEPILSDDTTDMTALRKSIMNSLPEDVREKFYAVLNKISNRKKQEPLTREQVEDDFKTLLEYLYALVPPMTDALAERYRRQGQEGNPNRGAILTQSLYNMRSIAIEVSVPLVYEERAENEAGLSFEEIANLKDKLQKTFDALVKGEEPEQPEPEAEAEEDKPESSTESTLKDNDRIATAVDLVMNSLPKEVRDKFLNLFSKYKDTPPKSEEEVIEDRDIFLDYLEAILNGAMELLQDRHQRQSLSGNEDADSNLNKAIGDLYNYLNDRFNWFMFDLTDLEELVGDERNQELQDIAYDARYEIIMSNDLMADYVRREIQGEDGEQIDSIEQAQSIMDSLSGLRFPANFIPAERTRRDDNEAKDMAKKASNSERNKAWDDARKNLLALIDNETDPAKLKTLVGMFIAVEREKNKWSLLFDASLGQISFQELTREGMDELFAKHLEKDASIFEAANRSPELISAMRNEASRIYAELGKTEDAEPETETETPAVEPDAEPTTTPDPEEEDEEEETELTPDRELESVKASDLVAGDLMWDPLRGFSRVTADPTESKSNPNNVTVTHQKPGDPEAKKSEIRKNASVSIAKRDKPVQPRPQPTPQPEPAPQPEPEDKPKPKPEDKPKPGKTPEPKKTNKVTRVYFIDVKGIVRYVNLEVWSNPKDRESLIEKYREIEAARRERYDKNVAAGLTNQAYEPMYFFEDGSFEHSSEAATKKQLDSIVRRVSIPGLLSEKEKDELAKKLPTMSKKAIFDLIGKLDNLELQWRMDNGYPIDDLIKKRLPVGFDTNKIRNYVPTKSMSDMPVGETPTEEPPVSAMEFMDAKTASSDLGVILNPATMDAGDRLPTPGAFTGALSDAVQGKNWAEVLDYLRNLETPIYYFDTETTGISDYDGDKQSNSALQVGIVKVVKGEVAERFNIYVNPDAPLGKWSAENLQRDTVTPQGEVIGSELVTDDWLSKQMDTTEAVRQMIDFMGNNPLIGGQNVPFDLEVLQRMLDKAGVTDFKVAGTVDSKDLIDVLIPKYNADTGVDGPKKWNEAKGQYDSTTSLGYVAKFLGFDTTRWHSADADAEDAFRLVMRSLEIALDNPTKNLEALDAKSLLKNYRERMAKFLASVSPDLPSTPKQRGEAPKGFREYLSDAGLTIQEQNRVLSPIKRMTRGQAAAYISKIIEEHRNKGQQTLPLKLNLQEFIDDGKKASDLVLPTGAVLSPVSGIERFKLIRAGETGSLAINKDYAEQIAFEGALGGPEEALKILSNPNSSRNARKIEEAKAVAAAKVAKKPKNIVTLSVDDNNFIVYDSLDGVAVGPDKIEKLAQLMGEVRKLAPIGNRKLRVQLVTEEQMDLLNRQRPGDTGRNVAFFMPDTDYMHIVMRKEDFYKRTSDNRMTENDDQGLTLHSNGNFPTFVRTFLHEYGHAYHYIMVKTNPIIGNEEFSPLAIKFKEQFGDTFITNYGEKSHHEKFAELFFDYAYSKLANRTPANPEFMQFIEEVIADKSNKPVGNASLLTSIILKRGAPSKLGFAESGASIRGTNVGGITEITGKNLTELERSMEGYSRGNWLAGTDAGSGLVPPIRNAKGKFNEDYFDKQWLDRTLIVDGKKRENLTPEELDDYRQVFIDQVEQTLADTRTYRVFQINGTNQFIRVKDAVANPDQIADLVKNVQMMSKLNNLNNIPTYYTLFPNGTFTYDAYIESELRGGITDAKVGEHGVFIGLNVDVNFNKKGKFLDPQVKGRNAELGGPDAKDRFNRTSIHEYGHGIGEVYLGDESSPLYQEFQRKFGDKPMSVYGASNVRENFAEYFYSLYMWVTERGIIPPHLREYADFFNENISGKNPVGRLPRELIDLAEVGSSVEPNFPSIREDIDPLSEFSGRRRFYENGLTPVGGKLDDADAEFISELYNRALEDEKNYLVLKDSPSVPETLKNRAKLRFISQIGALKAAYDSLVFSGNDKYDLAKEFPGEKPALMNFSEGWKDDQQGYPVIWDSYEDMPVTYSDPLEKDVFDAEERSALKNYGNSGWRWISSLLRGDTLSPTVSDMAESMLRGLANAFKKPEAKLTRDMYLYHGSAGYPGDGQYKDLIDAKPGDELTLPSYTSTSMSPNIAYEDFGPGAASLLNPEEGFFVIIRAPKGSNAIVMPQGLTYRDSEREVLLNSGAKLRVLEVSRSPRLDFEGYAVPGAYSTYIEADLVSTESMPDRGFETPAGLTRDSGFEQNLDYLTAAFADSFNRDLSIYTNRDGGVGSSNSVVGYVTPAALSKMRGNVELDKDNVEKKIRSMSMGVLPTSPVVVAYNPETKSAFVLDGNHRVAAALESNVPFLPVMVVTTDATGPESKKLDKGWAISPFGIDETGTSERWPDSFHPYFVFNDEDMLTPARNGGKPMFAEFEPSVWSSKVPAESSRVPKNLVPERAPSATGSQYELEQLHPGSYVMNKKTGKIGVVYGASEVPDPRDNSKILSGLIVRYLEGSEESYPSAFFTDDIFDEKGVRRMATGLVSVDGYSDIRYHTLRVTNPANLELVTEDFITPGTNGIMVDETMFGVIKDTQKRGHIVGFPNRGVIEVAVSNGDGSFSFEKIPVSKFLPIQRERTAAPGTFAEHSKDMWPTIDDVDSTRTKLEDLYNWGFLRERVYLAMTRAIEGKFLTKSGVAELRNALNKADLLRKRKRAGVPAPSLSAPKERLDGPLKQSQPVATPTQMPQNVGDMTIDEFMQFLQGRGAGKTTLMQFDDGEENTSPTVETAVETDPPTASDIRTVQDIAQEAGVLSDKRAKQVWEMLPLLDAEQMRQLKATLLGNLLDKRVRLNQPISGIEIPNGYNKSKLEGYVPTVNLDGSPIQTRVTSDKPNPEDIQLSDEQKGVYNHVESTTTPIYITGKAGTGKSFLLKFLAMFSAKKLAVVAPTGAAADNVGGSTIHSFFGFKVGIVYGNTESSRLIDKKGKQKDKVEARLKALEMLIVDEVSMVSADLLDAMDRTLRRVRGKQFVPFGGVQLVMFGDVHQLPPVVPEGQALDKYMKETFRSPHFFDARTWVTTPLEVYELTEVFRQSDPEFKKALNNIRVGMQTEEDMNLINGVKRDVPSSVKDLVFAVPRRKQAQEINDREMNALGNVKSMTYTGEFNGLGKESFGSGDELPSPESLPLKVGARVMFTMNDNDKSVGKDLVDAESGQGDGKQRRWINGTVGTVVDLLENSVKVDIDGVVHEVTPATWERVGYDVSQKADPVSNQISDVLTPFTEATYKQIPLMPAWALTIHKLQGKTLDNMKLDLGEGAFAKGQVYTALSRVRSLGGLYLARPIVDNDIKVDDDSLRFTRSTTGLGNSGGSGLSLMEFGGEPFDPADPNLDLDKELNYDFTSGPYGIPLQDYQEDMMKTYADMIAQAEKQFGSNSNRVKQLKSTRREHYASYFARPDQREDNIMEQATENLEIDFDGSTTTERETPTVVESTTKISASYKDRYGRPYRLEAQVVRSENDYDPQQLDTSIEIHAYDPANPDVGSVSSFATRTGGEMAGTLANEMFIDGIYTAEAYQRRHLATGLMAFARKLTDRKIYHSDKLTRMGHAFMESVEMDDRLKTIRYPSLIESQEDADGALSIDITKLSKTKSSAEITDLLQRLNADQIPYKLTY